MKLHRERASTRYREVHQTRYCAFLRTGLPVPNPPDRFRPKRRMQLPHSRYACEKHRRAASGGQKNSSIPSRLSGEAYGEALPPVAGASLRNGHELCFRSNRLQLKRCLEPPILNVLSLWQIHDILVNGRLYLASAAKTQP